MAAILAGPAALNRGIAARRVASSSPGRHSSQNTRLRIASLPPQLRQVFEVPAIGNDPEALGAGGATIGRIRTETRARSWAGFGSHRQRRCGDSNKKSSRRDQRSLAEVSRSCNAKLSDDTTMDSRARKRRGQLGIRLSALRRRPDLRTTPRLLRTRLFRTATSARGDRVQAWAAIRRSDAAVDTSHPPSNTCRISGRAAHLKRFHHTEGVRGPNESGRVMSNQQLSTKVGQLH